MPLTDEQKQTIRDEEFFRAEVRREMADGGPQSVLGRVSEFFETKVGFWVLTTVLAGIAATGITSLQRYMDRAAIAQREKAERSLRDAEMVLKIAPMLTSEKLSEVKIAIVLLTELAADEAVDASVKDQVLLLIREAVDVDQDGTPREQARAAAIISFADKPRVEAIQQSDAGPPPTPAATSRIVARAIDNVALPVRLYIQIGQTSDRPLAEGAQQRLQAAGLIVPGIELVGGRRAPPRDELRYCEGKVADDAVERVRAAMKSIGSVTPAFTVLDPKLCGNVRYNHFELWLARRP